MIGISIDCVLDASPLRTTLYTNGTTWLSLDRLNEVLRGRPQQPLIPVATIESD